MALDVYLLVFALAFMGCVLAIPVVTQFAHWVGAIDRPDQFRRIHKGATPRMGGLGLAFGFLLGLLPTSLEGAIPSGVSSEEWIAQSLFLTLAIVLVLAVGLVDDARGVSPRMKILGQSLAVVVLYVGGLRIELVELLGYEIPVGHPFSLGGSGGSFQFDPSSFFLTLLWFLGCMNVWNLIDGMDGLASGVGLVVTVTLMLVAVAQGNLGAALIAAALAGGLAGFLLYNWHPACIFLGDSGSLLIGLLLGVIGLRGAAKPTGSISILIPILAMGLPISDTALAIFRRWARNLPLTAADRSHVHHLLIGLGLNPRQAAAMLYTFAAFLCGMVLLGVAAGSDMLALGLGLWGAAAFLFLLYSRRDDLANLRDDLAHRMARGRQERAAAKITWEAIQRIEICPEPVGVLRLAAEAALQLGCQELRFAWSGPEGAVHRLDHGEPPAEPLGPAACRAMSSVSASFRLVNRDATCTLLVEASRIGDVGLTPDICFRFLHRLGLAATRRLTVLHAPEPHPCNTLADGQPSAASPQSGRVIARPPRALLHTPLFQHLPLVPRHAGPGQD